jgi:hypothetical protein
LENWLAEDKLECTEELGDLVKVWFIEKLDSWSFFEMPQVSVSAISNLYLLIT